MRISDWSSDVCSSDLILFRPANEADLIEFLAGCPGDVPVTVLGVGSNTLIRDGGLPGAVIRLGKAFATARAEGEQVIAGTGELAATVAAAAPPPGLTGLEILSGIPGPIGGALRIHPRASGPEAPHAPALAPP